MLVQAAFLSAPQYVVHGPTTLKDLRRATVCVAATEDGAKGWVQSIVQVSSNASLCYCKATDWQDLQACSSDPIFECEFSISAQLEQCHKLLDDGTVDAIVAFVRSVASCSHSHLLGYTCHTLL